MEVGLSGEFGEFAVKLVEVDRKHACARVPTPLLQVEVLYVQGVVPSPNLATPMDVQVRKTLSCFQVKPGVNIKYIFKE